MSAPAPKSEREAVSLYRPYVVSEASRFASGSVAEEDLIQEGLLAVALAYRAWKPELGAGFLTWIRKPVRYAMLKVIREQKRGGGSFLGGKHSSEKKTTGVRLVSMDAPLEDVEGDEGTLHDVVGASDDMPDTLALELLPELLSKLDARERKVLRLRFEGGLTYAQVGLRMKVSRELARQIETRALARLKALMADREEA